MITLSAYKWYTLKCIHDYEYVDNDSNVVVSTCLRNITVIWHAELIMSVKGHASCI